MATVILIRHGRSTANTAGVLAGRQAGVGLDAHGWTQAQQAAQRLRGVSLETIVSSPLKRCRQTARAIADAQPHALDITDEREINECDYGRWQGRTLSDLAGEDLWTTVQTQPSAAVFPGGESLTAMQSRAVQAVRRHDAAVEASAGSHAVWAAVSHGDIIKSVIADALGTHLDLFQRIVVNPASLTIIRYTSSRPYLVACNTDTGDLSWLAARPSDNADESTDAAVGGGAGPEPASARA